MHDLAYSANSSYSVILPFKNMEVLFKIGKIYRHQTKRVHIGQIFHFETLDSMQKRAIATFKA